MTLQSALALAGHAALVACIASPLLRRFPARSRAALLAVVMALVLAPLGILPAAAYLRGALGDLSVTSLVLLAAALLSSVIPRDFIGESTRRLLFPAVTATAIVFYPFALGFTAFDPYGAGYGSHLMLGILAALTFAAWFVRHHAIVVIIATALAAQLGGALESTNLWDYLLDPLLAVYAMIWCARRIRRHPAGSALPPTS